MGIEEEHRGQCLLEAVRRCDVSLAKRLVAQSPQSLTFKDPFSHDTLLHLLPTSKVGRTQLFLDLQYRVGAISFVGESGL